MDKTYNIALNMNKSVPVLTGITLCQGDKGIKLLINIVGFKLATGMTAKVIFLKADNTCVEGNTATMSTTDNTVAYTIAGNEIAAPGKTIADVKFFDSSNNRLSSASFIFDVSGDTLSDDAVLSTSYVSALTQAINTANTSASSATSAASSANTAATAATAAASLANTAATAANTAASSANTAAAAANAVSSQVAQINEKLDDLGLSVDTDGYIVQEVEEEE